MIFPASTNQPGCVDKFDNEVNIIASLSPMLNEPRMVFDLINGTDSRFPEFPKTFDDVDDSLLPFTFTLYRLFSIFNIFSSVFLLLL